MDENETPPEPRPPEPADRVSIVTPMISRDLRQRLIFYGIWGALAVAIAIYFRGILLPFMLALLVAYVMSPLVDRLERRMKRWVAVVVIYIALVGSIVGFSVIGLPRLAAEIEKLAREVPSALAEARNQWLPEMERRIRRAMGQSGPPEAIDGATSPPNEAGATGAAPEANAPDAAGAEGQPAARPLTRAERLAAEREARRREREEAMRESISVRPARGGGYEITLPPDGFIISPEGSASAFRRRITSENSATSRPRSWRRSRGSRTTRRTRRARC